MLPFLHGRLRTLGALLERSGTVLTKYNSLDIDTPEALEVLLDDATTAYRDLGRAPVENRMLALKAECITARHGTHPLTLERVTTHRRAMQRAIALRVLQVVSEQIRTDIEDDTRKLADASALLRPIVLAGIQRRIVPVPWPTPADQQAVERLWRELLGEADLALATRQLAMQASVYDIHLLLAALLESVTA
jgi:hypothetical protein